MSKTAWWKETFGSEYGTAFEHFYDEKKTSLETSFVLKRLPRKKHVRILDLPCGQGRHVAALAKRGHEVIGIDYSKELIASAKAAVKSLNLKATVCRGDMRTYRGNTKFDAVITLGNSFGYFSDADNRKFIANVVANLNAGGVFVLDLPNVPGLIRDPLGTNTIPFPGGEITTSAYGFDPLSMRLKIKWYIKANGSVSRTAGEIRLYTPPEIIGVLESSGFRISEIRGDFANGKYSLESPRLIIVAVKK